MCDEGDPPVCPTCGGEQYVEYCEACKGTGAYKHRPCDDEAVETLDCDECNGEGWYLVCADCDEQLLTEEVKQNATTA